jgi:tetratricopeptide (TPR) repeat protein
LYSLALVLVVFSILTMNRNRYWKDNLTLLAKDVKTCPESARIRYAYGSAILIEQAMKETDPTRKSLLLDQAIFHLEKGVSILSTYADAFYHLALAYREKGDTLRAIQAFESAKRSKTWNDADFYLASGLTYGAAGRYADAFRDLHRANELRPSSADVLNNIGMYMTEAGHTDSAIYYLNRALALDSLKPSIFYNLGNTLARQGRYREAISQYARAIELDSLYEDAYNNTGNCFAALNQHQQALYYYEKVLQWNPDNSKVINNIAVTYFLLGDTVRAKMYMDRIKK